MLGLPSHPRPQAPPTEKKPRAKRPPKEEPARGLPSDFVPSVDWKPEVAGLVSDYLEELTLAEIVPPHTFPTVPDDFVAIGERPLGTLFGQFTAMVHWLEEKVAFADMEATELENILESVKAETRLTTSGTVADKTAICLTSPRVIDATKAWLVADAKAKILKSRMRGNAAVASALSREISRRDGARMLSGLSHGKS